jgi:ribosomal protein L12E/L44/L45/RPP1/RPP2
MAVTFEEVSAEISPTPPAAAPAPAAAAPDGAAPDGAALAEQIEQTLRVRAEREARLCDQ